MLFNKKENENFTKSKRERDREIYLKKAKEKKKLKKKQRKKLEKDHPDEAKDKVAQEKKPSFKDNYQVEYVDEELDPDFFKSEEMKKVFEDFKIKEQKIAEKIQNQPKPQKGANNDNDNENADSDAEKNKVVKLSKKKQKKLSQMRLADLKQLTKYPEVVESWDVTSSDPKLLIYFKSLKNTVPVPKHWAQKRKYLQNKRGTLRPPFKLPDFIEATGISKIRNIDEHKGLKQKMRERMQPKLGRMDIDYQILHDAFFKYQTKPQLSSHGGVYYENKEFENKMKVYQPGKISSNLRQALGIPEGAVPPFVANMQRFGPPPSYPNLKIPGVNAPLNDPTADITPNLWAEPVINEKKELVWDFEVNNTHWGELREEEDYSDEDDNELGGDEDDLELSDDEKPNVEGIFDNNNASVSQNNTEKFLPGGRDDNNRFEVSNSEGKFYDVLEQKDAEIKEDELHPVGYKYNIPKKEKEKNEKEISEKNESEGEESKENSDDEENIGKKIF